LYDPTHHPDLQNFAHCILCHASISTKGRTTTGLTKHLQYKHREEYEKMNERSVVSMRKDTEGTPSVASIFQKKGKDKSVADIKMEYLHAVTNFIIAESHAFTIAASFEFHSLFQPFHKDADKITNVTPHKVREQVFSLVLERLQREQQSWKPVSKEDRGPPTIGQVVMMQRTPRQLFITSRTGKCVASSLTSKYFMVPPEMTLLHLLDQTDP